MIVVVYTYTRSTVQEVCRQPRFVHPSRRQAPCTPNYFRCRIEHRLAGRSSSTSNLYRSIATPTHAKVHYNRDREDAALGSYPPPCLTISMDLTHQHRDVHHVHNSPRRTTSAVTRPLLESMLSPHSQQRLRRSKSNPFTLIAG